MALASRQYPRGGTPAGSVGFAGDGALSHMPLRGERRTAKGERSWNVQARMTSAATGEVRWVTSVSVSMENDLALQQSRLAAA